MVSQIGCGNSKRSAGISATFASRIRFRTPLNIKLALSTDIHRADSGDPKRVTVRRPTVVFLRTLQFPIIGMYHLARDYFAIWGVLRHVKSSHRSSPQRCLARQSAFSFNKLSELYDPARDEIAIVFSSLFSRSRYLCRYTHCLFEIADSRPIVWGIVGWTKRGSNRSSRRIR